MPCQYFRVIRHFYEKIPKHRRLFVQLSAVWGFQTVLPEDMDCPEIC